LRRKSDVAFDYPGGSVVAALHRPPEFFASLRTTYLP
jgi:hypothetical protein